MHKMMVESKNSLLTGRNLWQNKTRERQRSAVTGLGLRGQEGGDNKQHSTKLGMPAEKEKHKLCWAYTKRFSQSQTKN